MIYQLLRWISGIALHWFYGDIRVFGEDRIPANGPLLVAVNHQNALVDSLLIGWLMPRKITMTAKATLLENPFVAALFNLVGVVPLRRASDESRKGGGSPIDRSRNAGAFHEILGVLEKRGAVLIFPEGKLLGAADLVLHTSHADALPTTLINALAVGVPVVATRVGGIPDIITDAVGTENIAMPASPATVWAALQKVQPRQAAE